MREDGEAGGESVGGAVLAGGGFAGFGTRAGTELGVLLIGGGLSCGSHFEVIIQRGQGFLR